MLPRRDVVWDEDCLFLNIYTPEPPDRGIDLPVLFWIHGGSYINGSGNDYDGSPFAVNGDMVVVTINYRLGMFGFAEFGHLESALTGSHNNGVLDAIEALCWVRDNIASFGGDSGRVTICGESAGAGLVNALMSAPSARGLFNQAISQSAPARFGPARTDFADALRSEFGAGGPASLETLRSASADELLAAQTAVLDQGAASLGVTLMSSERRGFRPAIDGLTVDSNPHEAVAESPVPLLIGTNLNEGTLFSFFLPDEISNDELESEITRIGHDAASVTAAFRAEHPDADNRKLAIHMLGDTLFRTSSLAVADAQTATDSPVYVYLFSWQSQGFNGMFGAMHALEIPFIWKQPLEPWTVLLGEGSPWPPELSDHMHRSWISFVHTGDPNHVDIPHWPAYDTTRRATMEFGDTSRVVDDPHGATRASWLG